MPNPTSSSDWPQQQAINRMIGQDVLSWESSLDTAEAAMTAAEAAMTAKEAAMTALEAEITAMQDYLGEDCAGGDCSPDPPFGKCGNCNAGTTAATYTLGLSGVVLDARSSNPDDWENYFNGAGFELAQASACVWTLLDDTTALPDYAGGVTLNSIVFTLTIASNAWFLDITGYANNDGTGTSTVLLQVFTSSDTAGTTYDPNTCNDISGASYWYRNGTGQNWNVPASDEIPNFDITLGGATIQSPSQ